MGNLADKADKLGLLKLDKTVLYAGASFVYNDWKWGIFTTKMPNTGEAIRSYLAHAGGNVSNEISRPDRNKTLRFLAPKIETYVEADSKVHGFWAIKPSNYGLRINIFCNNDEHIRGIAKAVDSIFDKGVIKGVKWETIEKLFKVDREDCIKAWEKVL
jgi:hypothetical protein